MSEERTDGSLDWNSLRRDVAYAVWDKQTGKFVATGLIVNNVSSERCANCTYIVLTTAGEDEVSFENYVRHPGRYELLDATYVEAHPEMVASLPRAPTLKVG